MYEGSYPVFLSLVSLNLQYMRDNVAQYWAYNFNRKGPVYKALLILERQGIIPRFSRNKCCRFFETRYRIRYCRTFETGYKYH